MTRGKRYLGRHNTKEEFAHKIALKIEREINTSVSEYGGDEYVTEVEGLEVRGILPEQEHRYKLLRRRDQVLYRAGILRQGRRRAYWTPARPLPVSSLFTGNIY